MEAIFAVMNNTKAIVKSKTLLNVVFVDGKIANIPKKISLHNN